MDQTTKDTIYFCLDFVKNNYSAQSQNVQCRNWIKMAMDLVSKSDLPTSDFIVANLKEADDYFSGVNGNATSNTLFEKIEMVKTLLTS
ncbi:hypothetical protein QE109_06725 [Fusibacter bizertensis]|uniref:Uncharacterized protein n=1 Tax=Fusibacter bizertensis TaxID=1488331 RepID=A0ABT6NBN1_9FIRM|nr:hypothetical protein [Fusibacter bizertensis]MDH8677833.1 hypothetical protein [Fusibacter bizertensis]